MPNQTSRNSLALSHPSIQVAFLWIVREGLDVTPFHAGPGQALTYSTQSLTMASPDEFFNGSLSKFVGGTLPKYVVFELGLSPELSLKTFPRAIMFMPQSTLNKAVEKHGIDLTALKNLPSMLCDPLRFYKSKTVANSFVFQLSSKWMGEYLVAAAEHVHHADFGTSYMVKSIHTRQDYQLAIWETDGLLLYQKK